MFKIIRSNIEIAITLPRIVRLCSNLVQHVIKKHYNSGTDKLSKIERAWIIVFFDADTLCYTVTLTFSQLILKVGGTSSVTCSKSERNLNEIAQSPGELLIILQFFCTRRVTLWPWPLISWPWTFITLQCHAFKLCTKFERNRIIHGWVISRFRRSILGDRAVYRTVLTGAWSQLHQTWRWHKAIIAALQVWFSVRISCCIFKCGRLKLSDFENDALFVCVCVCVCMCVCVCVC